eukprot:8758668-Heterocapsa_arctica.AAC.1
MGDRRLGQARGYTVAATSRGRGGQSPPHGRHRTDDGRANTTTATGGAGAAAAGPEGLHPTGGGAPEVRHHARVSGVRGRDGRRAP